MSGSYSVSFVQQKGGTGKSTSTLNVAGCLAAAGRKTLVIDLDPQASATTGSGIDPGTLDEHIYNVLIEGVDIRRIILDTAGGYHIAPAGVDLVGAEAQLYQMPGRRLVSLRLALDDVRDFYDYILIDSPPGSGLLAFNGIIAADMLLCPFDPGVFALESFKALETLLEDVGSMLDADVNIGAAILTKWRRVNFSWQQARQIESLPEKLAEKFGRVFIVPFSHAIADAQLAGVPINQFAPESKASLIYQEIADFIEEMKNGG